MSTIKEFRAFRPDIKWYQQIMAQPPLASGITQLQRILEPINRSGDYDQELPEHKQFIEKLIEEEYYLFQQTPAIYLYECKSRSRSQIGIWTLTSLDDLVNGTIVPHEDTLSDHQEQITAYREEVGVETSPILLTYRPSGEINAIIAKLISRKPQISFDQECATHSLWCITSLNMIKHIKEAFKNIQRVYVADGHHRLESAAVMHQTNHQFISTLYVSTDDIACEQFQRLVKPNKQISSEDFFEGLSHCFDVSTVPGNRPYVPVHRYQFGLLFKGQWHQINVKREAATLCAKTDVEILQSHILDPLLGISDPRTDKRLKSFPTDQWEMLMAESRQENAMVFTVYPMGIEELIERAENKIPLPPKSTYILPKTPFGLLLYIPKIDNKKAVIT